MMAMGRGYYDESVRLIDTFDEYTLGDGRVLTLGLVDDIVRSSRVFLIYCGDVVVYDFDSGDERIARESFFAVCDVVEYLI